jgi:hypothetical protein
MQPWRIAPYESSAPLLFPFLLELAHPFQDRFAGKDLLGIPPPLTSNDALSIDEEEPPHRRRRFPVRVETAVTLNHIQVGKVAQQRIRQLERIGECLLRERIIGADSENLYVQAFKLAVIGLPG